MIGYSLSGWAGTNTGIPAVSGPLSRSVRDLSLLTRVVRDTKPWLLDPSVIPSVLEIETKDRKPVVGLIKLSGITPHPPVRRAIEEAAAKLRGAGFEVKNFTPPDFLTEIKSVTKELFTLDGLSYPKGELESAGEPVVESVKKIGFWELPRKTQEQAWALNAQRLQVGKRMLDAWNEARIDVVLSPAGPHTAVLPGDWTSDIYTVAWNSVDVRLPVLDKNPTNNLCSSIRPLSFRLHTQIQRKTLRIWVSKPCT